MYHYNDKERLRCYSKIVYTLLVEYRQAFRVFDKDGDGTISTEELGVVLRSLGQNPSPEELDDLVEAIDVDGDNF